MNTQALNEAIGLSQSGTKQLQLSGRGISSFWTVAGRACLSACLGRELIVTLSVKEGEREEGRDAKARS